MFIGNYKGGVGKTTSVLNFAENFTKMGKKILVLDLDPQSSLSEILVSNNDGQLITMSELQNQIPASNPLGSLTVKFIIMPLNPL